MNIFYAPPKNFHENGVELTDQEALHASKTLRYRRGDEITVVDGKGGWYDGAVSQISHEEVWVEITNVQQQKQRIPEVALAMGVIKKRDRLEFFMEKAVELGAREVALFRGDHTNKKNIRMDRLESIAISAMKQSLQAWLPKIIFFESLNQVLQEFSNHRVFAAHKSGDRFSDFEAFKKSREKLLLVGPEGDFSDEEMQLLKQKPAQFVSLGPNRLRAETAAISFLGLTVIR